MNGPLGHRLAGRLYALPYAMKDAARRTDSRQALKVWTPDCSIPSSSLKAPKPCEWVPGARCGEAIAEQRRIVQNVVQGRVVACRGSSNVNAAASTGVLHAACPGALGPWRLDCFASAYGLGACFVTWKLPSLVRTVICVWRRSLARIRPAQRRSSADPLDANSSQPGR